jgi:hypothetical protein
MSRDAIPLVEAAAEATVGYLVMRDLVLRGHVRGGRDRKSRRWWVSRTDLRRYVRERASKQANGNGAAATRPTQRTIASEV